MPDTLASGLSPAIELEAEAAAEPLSATEDEVGAPLRTAEDEAEEEAEEWGGAPRLLEASGEDIIPMLAAYS